MYTCIHDTCRQTSRIQTCIHKYSDHQHDDSVSSCSSKFAGEVNFSKLQQYIRSLIGDMDKAMNMFR